MLPLLLIFAGLFAIAVVLLVIGLSRVSAHANAVLASQEADAVAAGDELTTAEESSPRATWS